MDLPFADLFQSLTTGLDAFRFRDPLWLLLLLLIPVAALLRGRKGAHAAVLFSSTRLVESVGGKARNRAGNLLPQLRWPALALLIVALARPQFGTSTSESEASGIDIVLAVDLSSSMLALDMEDVQTVKQKYSRGAEQVTRLDAVKDVLAEFIGNRPNDRIGIIAFARHPYLVSPLTLNHEWLKQQVERLEVGLIEDRTNISGAITMSVNRLRDLERAKSRIVILLTDGAHNIQQGLQPPTAAEAAAAFGTKIYTVAAGTRGRVPTLRMDNRRDRILTDRRGVPYIDVAMSDFDAETLKVVAEKTGGRFFHAGNREALAETYEAIDEMEKTEVEISFRMNYRDIFFWPALLGFVLLGLEQSLTHTRYRTLP